MFAIQTPTYNISSIESDLANIKLLHCFIISDSLLFVCKCKCKLSTVLTDAFVAYKLNYNFIYLFVLLGETYFRVPLHIDVRM